MSSNRDSEGSLDDFLGFLVVIHDFDKRSDDELSLRKGDVIEIIENDDEFKDGWYIGKNIRSAESGLFPKVFTVVYAPSPAIVQSNQFIPPLSPNPNNNVLPTQTDISSNYGKNSVNRTLTDIDEVLSEINGNKTFYDNIHDFQPELNDNESQESSFFNSIFADINNWAPQDISTYFQDKGFEPSVCQLFVDHKITGNILLELELPHLKEMEITSFGTRFEIHKEIENLKRIRVVQEESKLQVQSQNGPRNILPEGQNSMTQLKTNTSHLDDEIRIHSRQKSRSMENLTQFNGENDEYQPQPYYNKYDSRHLSYLPLSPGKVRPESHSTIYQQEQPDNNSTISTPRNYSTSSSSNYAEDIRSPSMSFSQSSSVTERNSQDINQKSYNDNNNAKVLDDNTGMVQPRRYSSIPSSLGITKTISSSHTSSSRTSSPDIPDNVPKSRKENTARVPGLSEDNFERPIPKRSTTSPFRSKSTKKVLSNSSMNPFSSSNSKHQTSAFQEGINAVSPSEATKTADYSGWISKKGSGVGTWRSRYFTLHGTRLSYFASLTDTKERGLIDITAHKVLPLNQNEDKLVSLYAASTGSGKYCFKLVPPGPGSKKGVTFTAPRTHYFAVDNKKNMRAWMGALIKATIDRDETVPVISSCVTPTVSLPRAKQMLKEAQEQAKLNEATIRSRVGNNNNTNTQSNTVGGLIYNNDLQISQHQPNSPNIAQYNTSTDGNNNSNGNASINSNNNRNNSNNNNKNRVSGRFNYDVNNASFNAISPELSNYSSNSVSTKDSSSPKVLGPMASNPSSEALEVANKTRELSLNNGVDNNHRDNKS